MASIIVASPRKGAVPARCTSSNQTKQTNCSVSFTERKGDPPERLVLEVIGIKTEDRKVMLARVRAGLPSTVVKRLEVAYGSTQSDIAACLLMPLSTLRRRLKKAERLNVDESDRVVRLARIKDLARSMMQDNDAATIEWLRTPRDILGGESPMAHASTEFGAREVEDLIGRIRHGVFS